MKTAFCLLLIFPVVSLAGDVKTRPVDTKGIYANTKLSVLRKGQLPNGQDITVSVPVLYRTGSVFLDQERLAKILDLKKEIDAYLKVSSDLAKKGDELRGKWEKLMDESRPMETIVKPAP